MIREVASHEKPRNSMNALVQAELCTEMCSDQSLETNRRSC